MTRILIGFCLLASAWAAPPDSRQVLKSLEERYNRAKTLQVQFQETYTLPGRQKRTESGTLTLRKPGRMRWDYKTPAGKVFVSDGKNVLLYSPASQRVEKMKLKESEDMRAPLAFLLGKLDFDREFQNFKVEQKGMETSIQAEPKSDKLPYTHVTFTVGSDSQIRRLSIVGQDQSLLEFAFTGEELNLQVDDKAFRYTPPAGVQVVDMTQAKGNE